MPVTPVKPNTGNQSTVKPAQSAKPEQPVAPSKPAIPAKPNTGNQNAVKPSQPVKPAQPVAPSKPVTPSKPVQPTQPAQPATPVTPAKPQIPSKPAQAKTGLDAITTDEAAAYAQKLYDQTYEHGTLDGYNNAESRGGGSMTVFLDPTDSKSDIYNKITNEYNFWGWSEKDPYYNHAVATATKNYSNNSLEIYQDTY